MDNRFHSFYHWPSVCLHPAMIDVSVILTTYNSAQSIQRVVDAIRNQEGINSVFQLELIVVDDCSTDGTQEILRQNRIDFISTEHNSGGPNKGRNIGLSKATGACIAIADHDDVWHSNKLVTLLPYLKQAAIITSGYTLEDTTTGKRTDRIGTGKNTNEAIVYEANATFKNRLIRSHSGQQAYLGSILFSSELKHIRFEESFGMVDFDWVLGLFHNQTSIEVLKPLYTRFVDGKNLSLNADYRRKDFYYSLFTIEKYEELYPDLVALAYLKLHGSRARYFYLIGDMKKARTYFCRSQLSVKTMLYYLTTFAGSGLVKKHFNVFG